LPKFSSDFLEEMLDLRQTLIDSGASISGRILPGYNTMDIMIAYDLTIDNVVLSTETSAPFLAIAKYHSDKELSSALFNHLKPVDSTRSSDKHIYSIAVCIKHDSILKDYLNKYSHRLLFIEDTVNVAGITNFRPYDIGTPHCGGLSFLADMFGLQHFVHCSL